MVTSLLIFPKIIICALVDFDLLGPNFCNGSKWTQPKHNTYCQLISAPISKVLLFYGEVGAGDIVLSPLYSGGSLQYLRRNRVFLRFLLCHWI
ncbi:hypothetical protein H5410_056966 [Solanum commersonii]|uniref:Uncharacterized protein n=1 Tax=Solanum commersonii TaxID=4109 RepID=A0A9J5WP86_SOLCO|nr:hypothetical protein H5410_056966 [Solanum commersonii]